MPWDQCSLLRFSIPCSLSSVYSQDSGKTRCNEGKNELLSLLKAWQVPAEVASLPLVVSAKDLKEILCTTAAFLQGLCGGGTHSCTASYCSPVPGPPLPALILVSVPKQTGPWGFLGCSFGRGPGLSLWVSTLPFRIQRASLLFPQLNLSLSTVTVFLCLSVALGRCLGPTVILYKAEGSQGTYEDFPFFCLSSGTCLVASTLFLSDYGAAGATQSCCAAL